MVYRYHGRVLWKEVGTNMRDLNSLFPCTSVYFSLRLWLVVGSAWKGLFSFLFRGVRRFVFRWMIQCPNNNPLPGSTAPYATLAEMPPTSPGSRFKNTNPLLNTLTHPFQWHGQPSFHLAFAKQSRPFPSLLASQLLPNPIDQPNFFISHSFLSSRPTTRPITQRNAATLLSYRWNVLMLIYSLNVLQIGWQI